MPQDKHGCPRPEYVPPLDRPPDRIRTRVVSFVTPPFEVLRTLLGGSRTPCQRCPGTTGGGLQCTLRPGMSRFCEQPVVSVRTSARAASRRTRVAVDPGLCLLPGENRRGRWQLSGLPSCIPHGTPGKLTWVGGFRGSDPPGLGSEPPTGSWSESWLTLRPDVLSGQRTQSRSSIPWHATDPSTAATSLLSQ